MTISHRMVSYAQHGEDVVLARALAQDGPGYYVDVGAGSPDRASVTRHFYDLGWTGIHIEPRPDLAQELRAAREKDVVVQAAVSDNDGVVTLYLVEEDGDLSTISEGNAESLRQQGLHVTPVEVPMQTLDRVLEQVGPDRIDFLKIDVEGAEEQVLRGVDLRRWQPRVVVVEATQPNTAVPTYHSWESLLLSQDYQFASTDGLNRFYVRADLAAELSALLVPANPTDAFVPAGMVLLEEEVTRLRAHIEHVEADLQAKNGLIHELERQMRPEVVERATPRGDAGPLMRLAVVGTPRSGNGWLSELLADVFSAEQLAADHPADLSWEALPERLVFQLHWHPTEHLRRLLRAHHVTVVSVGRHPLDTLLSILRLAQGDAAVPTWLSGEGGDERGLRGAGPNDEQFLQWAEGPRAAALLSLTPEWWRDEDTVRVRYEELSGNPTGSLGEVVGEALRVSEPQVEPGVAEARVRQAVRTQHLEGGHLTPGAWEQVLLAASVERLAEAHADLREELGYSRPKGVLTDASTACRRWDAL